MDWLKDFLKPEIVWLVLGLAMLFLEFMLPGLIVLFFGIGACVVALVCLLSDYVSGSINIQLGIFIVSSLLSLLCLRKWLKGIFMGHVKAKQDISQELSEFTGERAVVTEKITPIQSGKVEFHGTHWLAEAEAEIEVGTVVEIVGKENITLKVKSL